MISRKVALLLLLTIIGVGSTSAALFQTGVLTVDSSAESLQNTTPVALLNHDTGFYLLLKNVGGSTVVLVKVENDFLKPEITLSPGATENVSVSPPAWYYNIASATIHFTSERGHIFTIQFSTPAQPPTPPATYGIQQFFIRDSAGNQFSSPMVDWSTSSEGLEWTNYQVLNSAVFTTVQSGQTLTFSLTMPGGTFQGQSFTFMSSNAYTLVIVTTRNNQYTYTVIVP